MTINPQNEAAPAASLDFSLGDRLYRSLRHADLGVADMAQILGVSRETVGRWMHDKNAPKRAALLAWSAVTNVSVEWLETGQAPKSVTSGPDAALPRLDSNQQPSGYASSQVSGPLTSPREAEVVELETFRRRVAPRLVAVS